MLKQTKEREDYSLYYAIFNDERDAEPQLQSVGTAGQATR